MSLKSNIVHRYFKKELSDGKILLKVDPVHLTGNELFVSTDGETSKRALAFDEQIWDDLEVDAFEEVSAMEFNLYSSGLI
ncbi:MAG: hypothetical protein AB7O48_11450 [Cyclobacteriaceae bacterium]